MAERGWEWIHSDLRREPGREKLMSFDTLIDTIGRLNVSVEALAALAAHLRIHTEKLDADPQVTALLETVVTCLGIDPSTIKSIPGPQLRAAIGAARAFLRQAEDLIDAPNRKPGWFYDDPGLLQSQGQASTLMAGLIAQVTPGLGDLDIRLRAPSARFLDVGTGVGLLAVAVCQAFPNLRVTGIDPWAPALVLARRNVANSGLTDRVELREQSITELDDRDAFGGSLGSGPVPFTGRHGARSGTGPLGAAGRWMGRRWPVRRPVRAATAGAQRAADRPVGRPSMDTAGSHRAPGVHRVHRRAGHQADLDDTDRARRRPDGEMSRSNLGLLGTALGTGRRGEAEFRLGLSPAGVITAATRRRLLANGRCNSAVRAETWTSKVAREITWESGLSYRRSSLPSWR
jgi:hypothetical protein